MDMRQEMGTEFSLTNVPSNHVWTGAQIQELLDTQVKYHDWKFVVQEETIAERENTTMGATVIRDVDLHIRAEWFAPDNVTGAMEKQQSRWWRVSKHSRKNELINAAFA